MRRSKGWAMPQKGRGSAKPRRSKKTTPEEIAAFYEKLRTGTAAEKLQATAKYFGLSAEAAKRRLRFWWPGSKYVQEFAPYDRASQRWDMPTDKLLESLNKHETIAATARALKTTPITLKKALERKGVVQRWVQTNGGGRR